MNRYIKAGVLGLTMLLSLSIHSTKASAADYTIVANDSLYKIGVLFDTDVKALVNNNNLTSTVIYPGQILDVPAQIHTVEKGDTLFLISLKYGISLDALRAANNKFDNLILPGDTLLIPSGQTLDSLLGQNNGNVDGSNTGSNSNSSNNSSSNSNSGSNSSSNSNSNSNSNSSTDSNNTADKAVISYTEAELDLLARLITAEATGQPYDAMVAVGAVVVNRVQSNEWPNSIESVIKHVSGGYYQFTPYKNGYINNPASTQGLKAAKAALKGSDPSNNAIFFFDDSSTNDWLWSKDITKKIGNMVFAK